MLYSIVQLYTTFLICLLIGFICMRRKMIDRHVVTGLSSILINIAMSSLMIISLQKPFSFSLLHDVLFFLLASVGVYLAGIPLALLVCRLLKASPSQKAIWLFAIAFPNVGYMGIPLVNAVYGQDAMLYVSMNMMVFNWLTFTIGVLFLTGKYDKTRLKPLLISPPIIATAFGFLFFIFSYSIPAPIYNTLELIGHMTTPLSMMIVGAQLSEIKPAEVFKDGKTYWVSFFRLLITPVLVYFVCNIIMPNPMMRNAMVLLHAMPAAASTTIMATQYNADYSLASKTVFITTALSAVTIPAILLLLNYT